MEYIQVSAKTIDDAVLEAAMKLANAVPSGGQAKSLKR